MAKFGAERQRDLVRLQASQAGLLSEVQQRLEAYWLGLGVDVEFDVSIAQRAEHAAIIRLEALNEESTDPRDIRQNLLPIQRYRARVAAAVLSAGQQLREAQRAADDRDGGGYDKGEDRGITQKELLEALEVMRDAGIISSEACIAAKAQSEVKEAEYELHKEEDDGGDSVAGEALEAEEEDWAEGGGSEPSEGGGRDEAEGLGG